MRDSDERTDSTGSSLPLRTCSILREGKHWQRKLKSSGKPRIQFSLLLSSLRSTPLCYVHRDPAVCPWAERNDRSGKNKGNGERIKRESSGNSLVAWSIRSVIENGLLSESVLQRSLLRVYLVCSFSTGREFIVVSFTDLKSYPFDYPCTQRPPCSANWHTPVA